MTVENKLEFYPSFNMLEESAVEIIDRITKSLATIPLIDEQIVSDDGTPNVHYNTALPSTVVDPIIKEPGLKIDKNRGDAIDFENVDFLVIIFVSVSNEIAFL